MNFKKISAILIGSMLGGYFMHYYVFCELLTRFISTNNPFYFPTMWFSLFFCIVCFSTLGSIVLYQRIPRYLYYTVITLYGVLLFITLFVRAELHAQFIWNLLDSFVELHEPEMKLQSLLNFLCFVPMGYLFRKTKPFLIVSCAVMLSAALELVQFLTTRGFFDTFDMILYTAGFSIGYCITKITIALTENNH